MVGNSTGLGMLGQLIGQLEEFLELHGSVPPPALPSNCLIQFLPPSHHSPLRWCNYFNLEDSSLQDSWCNMIMSGEDVKMLGPGKPPPPRKKVRNGEKCGVAEKMDYRIWKEFPEDLFEAVMARLPISSFFQLRSVCRKWNSVVESPSFSRECALVEQRQQPWFYTVTHENVGTGGAMYDPLSRKWRRRTLEATATKPIVLPVASAGGLVCLLDIGHESFYVRNPLTGSFRELPPARTRAVRVWSRVAVGMAPHPHGGYKVIWVGCGGDYEVYESGRGSWGRGGMVPSSVRVPLGLNFRSPAACVGGALHFLRSEPDGLLTYDVGSGAWGQVAVPLPPCSGDHALAEGGGGRVLLLGLLTKNAATCVCVWELQRMTLLWKEVDRMPNVWCLEFYGKNDVRMTCLGNKGLIMLSLRSRQLNRLVTYDISTREWLRVPGKRKQWIACGTAFHPCLTASP
ncbi:F-box only protein 6 [Striga hermonthica]|uniref:F-box only protein 6 n=1 Tax=Striga hermonthica TaxID=68872 RepID=A0A9N7R9Y5_STRHE|nr:F-box only protein 6 [Striga hermonthica]